MLFDVLSFRDQSSFQCGRYGTRYLQLFAVSRLTVRRSLHLESDSPSFEVLPATTSHRLVSLFPDVDLEVSFYTCLVLNLAINRWDS